MNLISPTKTAPAKKKKKKVAYKLDRLCQDWDILNFNQYFKWIYRVMMFIAVPLF